jgi:hypothetical protein
MEDKKSCMSFNKTFSSNLCSTVAIGEVRGVRKGRLLRDIISMICSFVLGLMARYGDKLLSQIVMK